MTAVLFIGISVSSTHRCRLFQNSS